VLAVRWHARGDVRVEEVPPPPPPGPGDVQLRVNWCGICGTDLLRDEPEKHLKILVDPGDAR
jgi:(R,R)-butanediol dehydrogenase / meso-butanediol dehydrogenase / diacetyl reductase